MKTINMEIVNKEKAKIGDVKMDMSTLMDNMEAKKSYKEKEEENIKDWGKKLAEVKRNTYTSIHQTPPIWSLGKDKRKELYNKTWTKNETYEIYSCVEIK